MPSDYPSPSQGKGRKVCEASGFLAGELDYAGKWSGATAPEIRPRGATSRRGAADVRLGETLGKSI